MGPWLDRDGRGQGHVRQLPPGVQRVAAAVGVCLRTLVIPVTGVTEFISTVRVSVDQRQQQDWNEIDAVRLSGFRRP